MHLFVSLLYIYQNAQCNTKKKQEPLLYMRPISPSQFYTDLPAHFEVFLSALWKLWTKKIDNLKLSLVLPQTNPGQAAHGLVKALILLPPLSRTATWWSDVSYNSVLSKFMFIFPYYSTL